MPLSSGQRAGVFVMAGVTLVTIACVVALFVTGKEKDRAFECKYRLTRLSQAIHAGNQGLAHKGWDSVPTGTKFWAAATEWPGNEQRTFPITTDLFECPFVDKPSPRIDFLGPPASIRTMAPDAPIGADRPGNHEDGGNVVLRNGLVHTVDGRHELWIRAVQTLQD